MPAFPAPDGTEVAYHVIGSGSDSAAPVICLPGGPMRASAYLGDLGGLAAHRQLILLDLRGTGESGHPADSASYRCDRQVSDVEALREHLGLHWMELLAHSAGGSLAVRYAAEYPHRIGTLALITPSTRAGDVDWILTPVAAAEFAGLFPNAQLIVQPGVSHYPWLDNAAEFVTSVAKFLG